ncbi:nucleoside/nucleotide kinase family protein [Flaviflexus huanghaiensis]|uniref:nucleoside/nucleotide kinase family protein n=1 Tax=Flaviflexus huanghaiensis TaxID=1111473 RepID=UPI0015F92B17|nr:nucleoside/nucleotide kinase family protein [Flaviflexus huanghaiensis]
MRSQSGADTTVDELIRAARAMAGRRTILGIAGAPGAGKSTLGSTLADALGDQAVVVGMDGFHYTNDELVRLGRRDRKGAPDTFDVHGYIALLTRLRDDSVDIYAPAYQRGVGHSISGAVRIPTTTPLVITEGNYLLLEDGPWSQVRSLLDECWYVDLNEKLRIERLIARHIDSGKEPDAARDWTLGPDQANAELVARSRSRADRVIVLP